MIEDTILTGVAVFLGSIVGGICVAEYTLHRGKNMITNSIQQAITQLPIPQFIKDFILPPQAKEKKEKPDDYE